MHKQVLLYSIFCLITIFSLKVKANVVSISLDSLPKVKHYFEHYTFLQETENVIVNATALAHFYKKLAQLENGEIDQVRIVHIGDSHVQADFWTGKLRRLFQAEFGSAGRGFVFPFGLAASHNPLDIKTNSNITWDYHRNIFKKGAGMGIGGASISTQKENFYIEIIIKDSLATDKFDKITLFNNKGASAYDFILGKGDAKSINVKKRPAKARYHRVRSGETLSHLAKKYRCSVRSLKRWNKLRTSRININQRLKVSKPRYVKPKTPDFKRFAYLGNTEYPKIAFASTLMINEPVNQLVIKSNLVSESQKETHFYGVVLENTTQAGVLYNAIGVNGATFRHYNQSIYFFEQLADLSADLVMVSLGTNESLGSKLSKEEFAKQSAQFLDNLQRVLPNAAVLITTNPPVLKKKKYPNPGNAIVRSVLINEATKRAFSFWDLSQVMGEEGRAFRHWQKYNLARKDGVHFTKKGYQIQAELLFNAIMKSYHARN